MSPLQYSCLENPMDGGAWWATVHGVAKNRTRLSDFSSLSLYQWRGREQTAQKTRELKRWQVKQNQQMLGFQWWGRTVWQASWYILQFFKGIGQPIYFLFCKAFHNLISWWYHNVFCATHRQAAQSLSYVWLFATPWTTACQASPSIANFWSLL